MNTLYTGCMETTQQINGAVACFILDNKPIDTAPPFCLIEDMSKIKTNRMKEADRKPLLHKHHIIPKHFGGMDYAWNIAELTVEEHADAHRRLYEAFGKWADLGAYNILKWVATQDPEALREAQQIRGRLGAKARVEKMTPEQRKALARKAGIEGGKAKAKLRSKEEHEAWGRWLGGKYGKINMAKRTPEERTALAKLARSAFLDKYTPEERSAISKRAGKARAAMRSKKEHSAWGKKNGKKGGKMTKGKLWYNNGEKDRMCFEGTQPEGFVKGRLKNPAKDRFWYNNGTINKRCYEGTQPKGFVRGILLKRKLEGTLL